MRPKKQSKIMFANTCDCTVDLALLEQAVIWYADGKTLKPHRKIYLHAKYPAVSIYNEKIHIHRLIMMYLHKNIFDKNMCVHHADGNKLNNSIRNLELIRDSLHGHIHNKGKTLSVEHRNKIAKANRKRKGFRRGYTRRDITSKMVFDMKSSGLSFNKISIALNLDRSCVKTRYHDYIHDNPELLND